MQAESRGDAPRIIVLGVGKAGTTALYYGIKEALPEGCPGAFEPGSVEVIREFLEGPGPRVCKFLPEVTPVDTPMDVLHAFTHRVFLFRDPRDQIVSGLLYRIWDSFSWRDTKLSDAWLAVLERKEKSPRSISMTELCDYMGTSVMPAQPMNIPALVQAVERLITLSEQFSDSFKFRYEALVRGEFEALEAWLGLVLPREPRVAPDVSRVVRTKKSGDWRNWFTPGDVEFFRPLLDPLLARLGYPLDWQVEENPVIPTEFASGYVRQVLAQRAQLAKLLGE